MEEVVRTVDAREVCMVIPIVLVTQLTKPNATQGYR